MRAGLAICFICASVASISANEGSPSLELDAMPSIAGTAIGLHDGKVIGHVLDSLVRHQDSSASNEAKTMKQRMFGHPPAGNLEFEEDHSSPLGSNFFKQAPADAFQKLLTGQISSKETMPTVKTAKKLGPLPMVTRPGHPSMPAAPTSEADHIASKASAITHAASDKIKSFLAATVHKVPTATPNAPINIPMKRFLIATEPPKPINTRAAKQASMAKSMGVAEEKTQKKLAMAEKDKRQAVTRVQGSKKELVAKKKVMLRGWFVDDAARKLEEAQKEERDQKSKVAARTEAAIRTHELKMKAESLRIGRTVSQPQMDSLQKVAQQQQAQAKRAEAAYAASQERSEKTLWAGLPKHAVSPAPVVQTHQAPVVVQTQEAPVVQKVQAQQQLAQSAMQAYLASQERTKAMFAAASAAIPKPPGQASVAGMTPESIMRQERAEKVNSKQLLAKSDPATTLISESMFGGRLRGESESDSKKNRAVKDAMKKAEKKVTAIAQFVQKELNTKAQEKAGVL